MFTPRRAAAAAAQAMRRILIENARQKGRLKHGGGRRRLEFTADLAIDMPPEQMLALDELLTRLAERDDQAARVVELHCFAGLPIDQVAEALSVSARTAYRDWEFARAWLFREVQGDGSPETE
jgi:RNA polymerase sigma factor (TIGR02999 family)